MNRMESTHNINHHSAPEQHRSTSVMSLDKEALLERTDWTNASSAEMKVAARLGNPHAKYSLCRHRLLNPTGEIDLDQAFLECLDAVTSEVPASLNLIGCLYMSGHGIFVNQELGFLCFEHAAELGDGKALYNLALCYAKGVGVDEPDINQAAQLMQKSARAGYELGEVGKARMLHLHAHNPAQRQIADQALEHMGRHGSRQAKRSRTWCANRAKQEAAGLPTCNHPVPVGFWL